MTDFDLIPVRVLFYFTEQQIYCVAEEKEKQRCLCVSSDPGALLFFPFVLWQQFRIEIPLSLCKYQAWCIEKYYSESASAFPDVENSEIHFFL